MTLEPLRILLVADDPEQIRRTGQGLQRQGSGRIVLEGADSLATARRRVSAGAYDLAILDLGLGEGPGVDVIGDFCEVAPNVPVVVLARDGLPGDLDASLAAGAADCLCSEALDCAGLVDRLRAAVARVGKQADGRKQHRRVGSALDAAGDLVWYWEPGGKVWLSAPEPATWGLRAEQSAESIDALRDRVHPDDRERAFRKIREALKGEGAWRIEARLKLGGGGYRWCESRGRVRRDAGGVLESVAGVVTDMQRHHNALRELERGRRQLRAVIDSDPVPHAIVNASGFVTDCNRAWMELDDAECHAGARFGPGVNFVSKTDEGKGPAAPLRRDLVRGLRQVLGGVTTEFDCEYGTRERRWRIRISPLLNPGIAGAVVRHEEVTRDRVAAAGASARLADLEAVVGAIPGPYFRLGPDFSVLEANGEARGLCRRDPDGCDLLKVLARPDSDAVATILAAASRGDGPARRDAPDRDAGVCRRWSARALREDGEVKAFFVSGVDVSDLFEEETGLQAVREAALASPVGLALVEGRGSEATIRWANPAFAAVSGKAAANLAGRRLADHLAGAGRWEEAELVRAMAEPATGLRVTVHRYDGAAWELAFAYAGKYTCITAADVADRERAVASLTALRQRLQGVLRGCGDGGWEWDEATRTGWLSPRALEILGLPQDTPAERFEAGLERVHRGDRARLIRAMEEAVRNGSRLDTEFRLEGASGAWIQIRGDAARGSRMLAGTLRDVSDARQARELLEERERHAVRALGGASVGTWSWSSGSGRLHVDAGARRLHDDDGDEGRVSLRTWLKRVDPADRRKVTDAIARAPESGRIRIEYRVAGGGRVLALDGQVLGSDDDGQRRADGLCRDITARRLEAEADRRAASAAATTLAGIPGMAARVGPEGGLEWKNEAWAAAFPGSGDLAGALGAERAAELLAKLRGAVPGPAHRPVVLPIHGQPRQLEAFISPVGDDGAFVVVLLDLTDEREADSRLFQVRKMEAVGQLAGGVAHEFNNLLGVIVGSLELLEAELAGQGGPNRRLGAALGAARQGADVSRRLLAFARQQDLEVEAVDPSAFVRGRSELLGRLLGPGCVLSLSLADEAWTVETDPGQLETALIHLVSNAAEAMEGGGRVTVSTANRVLDVDDARRLVGPSAEPGDYLEIAVEDEGPGIPGELASRVFDPFFTTKGPGKAAGLGLSQVWGLAQQSGGRARIDASEDGGARVSLLLPRACERRGARPIREEQQTRPAEAERHLVLVEPDAGLRETAAGLAESLGWRVRPVADAAEALRALEAGPADVLFTELAPGSDMDGATLASRATARVPGLGVVFSASRGAPRGDTGHPVVTKPYGRKELAAALTEAVEGRATHGRA